VTTPLEDAATAALRGELVVFPTDTVYGIGTRPDDPAATARVFQAKRRPRDLELPLLVPSVEAAQLVAILDDRAKRLADACWPGEVTLVLPRAPRSREWDLGGDPETVGVRVPRHALALALLSATGPLAASSANRSGESTPDSCEGLFEAFGDLVAVYLCQEERLAGAPSTVLDLSHGEARVLREGAIGLDEVRELL